jgi:SAM-dependent methyltransferase
MQRFSVASPAGEELPTDAVSYGPDIPREDALKLLGPVDGKRILDLGCGTGHNAIALARQGAKVIGVDESSDQVADARAACEREGVKVELHHAPLAELAFLRADTIDGAYSAHGLAPIEDIDRVFRQVHRILRPESALVLSFPHPAWNLIDPDDPTRTIRRTYWDSTPIAADGPGRPVDLPRTISSIFTSLTRANFRIDTVLEPEPVTGGRHSPRWNPAMELLPATLLLRARKQGS